MLAIRSSNSNSSSASGSYYGYINANLAWDAALSAAAGQDKPKVDVTALVLGLILGAVVLAALTFVLIRAARKRRGKQRYKKHSADVVAHSSTQNGRCCWINPHTGKQQWHTVPSYQDVRSAGSAFTAPTAANGAHAAVSSADMQHEDAHDVALLGSLGGYDTAGMLGRVGSAEGSRQGLHIPPAAGAPPHSMHSVPLRGDHSPPPMQHYLSDLADGGYIGPYEKKFSGGLDPERMNSSRAVQFGTLTGGGFTTDANTTVTEEGTGGQSAAGGGAGGQHKQHKQQVFEDARRRLGATAGDLARSDALVLESVLGEGTFGKVFKGTCLCSAVYMVPCVLLDVLTGCRLLIGLMQGHNSTIQAMKLVLSVWSCWSSWHSQLRHRL